MPELWQGAGWHLTTFGYAWLSGLVPILNCEVYLVWLAANAPRGELGSLVVMAAAGQMVAKSLLFWGGRGILRFPLARRAALARSAAASRPRSGMGTVGRAGLVFASALTGLPPFYATSVGCGAMRWGFLSFVLCGTVGRLARFSAFLLIPSMVGPHLPGAGALALLLTLAAFLPLCWRRWRGRTGAAPSGAVPAPRSTVAGERLA